MAAYRVRFEKINSNGAVECFSCSPSTFHIYTGSTLIQIQILKMAYRYACVLLTVALCAAPAIGFSAGAPNGACGDMIPQHHTDAQKSAAPYQIILSKKQLKAGEGLTITVQGNSAKDTIKGLLCQTRVGETPVGAFDVPPNNNYIQTLDCGNSKASAVTHKKITNAPNAITFNWVAPKGLSEEARVYCTIALNGGVFWVKHSSDFLKVN
ncbi:putative defense protein Hdd11 [Anopheles nili]|uniref:putative defense protein Hdd11 n=1 Tax=Anopheles nili TaxID=185578 RepID=UPI00237BD848|nr:putative defense protein Hdd11 [Anopheles nili]